MEPELRRLLQAAPFAVHGTFSTARAPPPRAAPSPTPHHPLAWSWITPPCCRHPRPDHPPAHQGQGQHTDPKTFQEFCTLHRPQRRFRTPTAAASGVLHHLQAGSRGQSVLCGLPRAVQLIQRCCRRAGCSPRSPCAIVRRRPRACGVLLALAEPPGPAAYTQHLVTHRAFQGPAYRVPEAVCSNRLPVQQRIPNLTGSGSRE